MRSALVDDGVAVAPAEGRSERSQDAFHVLSYNQELVQFVDSKAGTLIVVNSLFIAASSAADGPLQRGLEAACLLASGVAILACLRVVLAGRSPADPKPRRPDVVFFQDIVRRTRPGAYVRDFSDTSEAELASQILMRTYVVAGIAARKFDAYAVARSSTALAAVVWIIARGVALAV